MSATPPSDRLPGAEKGAPDIPSAPGSSLPTETENGDNDKDVEEKGKRPLSEPSESEVEEGEAEDDDEDEEQQEEEASAPPLPDEVPPPLPNEAPPRNDDGWEPVWDATAQSYYFFNRLTGVSQWDNPRVPDATSASAADAVDPQSDTAGGVESKPPVVGGYNPAIHGDYDPTAPYAQQHDPQNAHPETSVGGGGDPNASYDSTGTFNRFTGRWQASTLAPENYNDENKSRRQMNAFFDVDAAANSHDGRSLRAERSAKKLSKKELKMFKEKRREKKEEKRRAWLRD